MYYRRVLTKGGTYFFTLNTFMRQPILQNELSIHLLRNIFKKVKQKHEFRIDAIVILPDHLHAIWTLPSGDSDYPKRWSLIKAEFSRSIKSYHVLPEVKEVRRKKREQTVWQRRYWEHKIRDEDDYRRHVDYIHYNPVKHGYVNKVQEWPWSSFHRHVKKGVYPLNWGESFDVG